MSWSVKISEENISMTNGGGGGGVDGVKNCRGNDGMKGRVDDVEAWEDIMTGEAKAYCWYWK